MSKTTVVICLLSALCCCTVWCQEPAAAAPPSPDDAAAAVAADPFAAPDTAVTTASEVPDITTAPDVPDIITAPDVPDIITAPEVPDITTAPEVADITTAPEVPDITTAPDVPDVTTAPDVPDITTVPADTTAAPDTTTTTTTTTTTAAPTPAPPAPTRGRWSVSDDADASICILAQMAVQMKIPYLSSTNKTLTASINVPSNASALGSCSGSEYISISWPEDAAQDKANSLILTFAENTTAGRYSIDSITARLAMNDDNFPDHASDDAMISLRVNFSEPISLSNNTSYRCMSRQPFQMLTDVDDQSAELIMLETQLEAYRRDNTTKFSTPLVCSADHRATSDVVPIAVGVALAALVLVILIAYMIGRRRARQRGYQSV